MFRLCNWLPQDSLSSFDKIFGRFSFNRRDFYRRKRAGNVLKYRASRCYHFVCQGIY
ncbi:hypothetical protein ABI_09260 [Asticcacaulis biprosthecium C19]|uniref:Uncharacterized protein n=1 Tax=Asticcacaulis biprosthecium C19 TaxID=715226 RepID=F4QGN7_9CAUL|nr:hypothetical protein ABI_09260 [Asticcacaulis biprosthecium C19]